MRPIVYKVTLLRLGVTYANSLDVIVCAATMHSVCVHNVTVACVQCMHSATCIR